MDEYAYDAFISYSHRDLKWGRWLQKRLEAFPVPQDAPGRKGKAKLRVFRDQTDLSGAELQASLNRELNGSRYLIVICSPHSAASRWVNEEIRSFRNLGRKDRIIPFIVEGEPNSEQEELECFPPALRNTEDDEPLGANIQEIGKNKAFLKVVSVLLDIRLNRLVDREKKRRTRRILSIGAVTAAVVLTTGILLRRNYLITQKNRELSFDIYSAALVSLASQDHMTPEELDFIRASAEAGNTDAMMLLADCFLKGWGTEPDPDSAFHWYLQAAEAGDTQGMVGVGNCYMNGTGTEVSPEKVFEWNRKAAEAGNPAGMLNTASCFEEGYGTAADAGLAFEWYLKSAEAGFDLGMFHLARCYRDGIGTPADREKTFFWMEKLARTGNTDGMYNTALMYQYAYGTEENPREAYLWYRRAAAAGDAAAMRRTGWCLENSYGVTNAALEWYLMAAEAGDEEAAKDAERLSQPSLIRPAEPGTLVPAESALSPGGSTGGRATAPAFRFPESDLMKKISP